MRIISLLPAATEWIAALGATSELVGRSHACDAPPEVQALPTVTRPRFTPGGDTKAIDDRVQEQLREELSLYDVDLDRLRALEPDLLLTQAQCEVCAVSRDQLDEAPAAWTGRRPEVLSLQPMTLKQVFDQVLTIGRKIGRLEAAMRVLAAQELALGHLHDRLGLSRDVNPASLPAVACIEWMEPLMTAGHWMPDVAAHAGGRAVLAEKGAPSRCITWEALREADPDVIAVMPCGFSLGEMIRDLHYLTERDGWNGLRAVRSGRVYLFDGNAYFNRPGPRLLRSIELLAATLHPDRLPWDEIGVRPEELRPLEAVPATGV